MPKIVELADGLRFPEGPVVLADGSVVLVEIAAGEITRIAPDGTKSTVARPGGGPNGAALGPDGRLYVCNNGGMNFHVVDGKHVPGHAHDDAQPGWIEAVDLESGAVEVLYRECRGLPLLAPNDLAFDTHGGFYFTDHGKSRKFSRDRGGVYYAKSDGSAIERVVVPMEQPNGIGLSPDGKTLYVAETPTGRLWAFAILEPGRVDKANGAAPWHPGRILASPREYSLFELADGGRRRQCLGRDHPGPRDAGFAGRRGRHPVRDAGPAADQCGFRPRRRRPRLYHAFVQRQADRLRTLMERPEW